MTCYVTDVTDTTDSRVYKTVGKVIGKYQSIFVHNSVCFSRFRF